ncbi:filamentous hemagglutinin, partial [Propionispora vibrioides]
KKKIAYVTIFALVSQPLIVGAEAVADSQAAEPNRPKVETTQNGTPIVQITAPSAAGVSRNIYSQFNVDPQGLILNNSQTLTQTQLAGYITGNPNLANGTAKIILNEVSGHDPSILRGYTEVAGSRAEVVIANPNGITGNGFGFINASRAVLTTGTPFFGGNGSLEAFRVNQGQITVEGNGMDTQQTDRADLISRAVQVNAGIWGKEVNVVAGANQVEHDSLQATVLPAGNNRPQIAIDVSSLGGMYANKIRLVGTEQGVGVNSQGVLSASGDITMTSEGKVQLANQMVAGGNLSIAASDDISNQGTLYGAGNTSFNTTGTLNNTGTLVAGQNATITARSITSQGVLGAGVQSDGTLKTTGALTVKTTEAVASSGQNIAASDITMTGAALNLAGAQTYASGDITLQATGGDIDHTGSTLQTGGNLNVQATGTIKNDVNGTMTAGNITLKAHDISNRGGSLLQFGSGAAKLNVTGSLDNTNGTLASNGPVSITGKDLINRGGSICASNETPANVSIAVSGNIDNSQSGLINANGDTTITTANLDNTQGQITAGKELQIDGTQAIGNVQGTLAAKQHVQVTGATIDNTRGEIGSLQGHTVIQSLAGTLDNTQGRIEAAQELTLLAQGVTNTDGVVVGNQVDINTNRQNLENSRGIIAATGGEGKITGGKVNNAGGQIQSQGDLTLELTDSLTNTGGLMHSDQNLAVDAASIGNTGTQGTGQGMEGQSVSLSAAGIDNTQGAVRADDTVTITAHNYVNNTQGVLSSKKALALQDSNSNKTLVITNTGGTAIAGQQLSIDSAGLSGDGSLLSTGDLSLALTQDFLNTGNIQANGNVNVNTAGQVENRAKISSGKALTVQADTVNNTAGAELSGQSTKLSAVHTINNRGLIDGGETLLDAGTVQNIGTGRIYGDHLAIHSGVLNNTVENGDAATIAARSRLDIGSQTITNREHAEIFSMGNLYIGGGLDEQHQAVGQADTLNNNSATIEALGAMSLSAGQINNTNEHFSTALQQVSVEDIVEYQGNGSPNRYTPGTPNVYIYNDESDHLHTPEGNYETWNSYNYRRIVSQTQVVTTDPGKILSGGDMLVQAHTLNNDKSQMIAGGAFGGKVDNLNNVEVPGVITTVDTGSVTTYWRDHHSGRDSTGRSTTGYNPAAKSQDITLKPSVYLENTAPSGEQTQVTALQTDAVQQNPAGSGTSGEADTNRIIQVTTPDGSNVQSGSVNTKVSNSSMLSINPNPSSRYIVEIDPRFADYRTWISSDYMIQALSLDPDQVQKRLGDGFYEQQLVREQVTQLTGNRFLSGYSSDEEQYKALMDNASVFAQEQHLTVGVALTAEQMAQLTTDMVWLVDKEITLPSGETTHALVPQLYVRNLKEGDLAPSGALISGNTIQINASGDITNSGTMQSCSVVALTAENIRNLGGTISGDQVGLSARTDIDNLGGSVDATSKLVLAAGRDLNVVSTTSTQDSTQGSRTNINRIASLYVSGDNGILSASAGRDSNLSGAQISNMGKDGQTVLAAGNNINLGTVTETENSHIAWDGKNYRNDSSRTETGTTMQTQGDITLQAGQDLNARAATVNSSQGALNVTAGHDINLTVGENNLSLEEGHQHKSHSGMFSSKTVTTHDIVSETTVQSTTFSGDKTTVIAGRDMNVTGSNLVATNDLQVAAGGNISIAAAQETDQEEHMRQEKKSGVFSGGGIGFTIGSQKQKRTTDTDSVTQVGSMLGSTAGNVTLEAGKNIDITASNIVGGQDVTMTGNEITVQAGTDTYKERQTYEFKQSGLSVSLGGGVLNTISDATNHIERSGEVSDDRLKALYDYKAVKDVQKLGKELQGGLNKSNLKKDVTVSISIGSSKSTSEQDTDSETASRAGITAGDTLTMTARTGDVTLQGASINAKDITIEADQDINIKDAQNKEKTDSKSDSSSWALGVSLNAGLFGNASNGNSNGNGTVVTHSGTEINATDTVDLHSGRDTNIIGSQVKGKEVIANVGRDLNIASQQDIDNYAEKSSSSGIGFSTGPSGGVTGSASKGKINSEYASVTEQAGIYAGEDGFDITVGKNTDLKGAVISSEATPDKNRLSTDTLTYSDIENHADYSASSVG